MLARRAMPLALLAALACNPNRATVRTSPAGSPDAARPSEPGAGARTSEPGVGAPASEPDAGAAPGGGPGSAKVPPAAPDPFAICGELGTGFPVKLSLSPEGQHFAVLFSTGRVQVHQVSDGALLGKVTVRSVHEDVSRVELGPGARTVTAEITGFERKSRAALQELRTFPVAGGQQVITPVAARAFSSSGALFIPPDPPLRVLRTTDRTMVWSKPELTPRSPMAAFSADERYVVLADAPHVLVVRAADGVTVRELHAADYESYFETVVISADGSWVAVSYDDDPYVDAWRTEDGHHTRLSAPSESDIRFTGPGGHLVLNEQLIIELTVSGPRTFVKLPDRWTVFLVGNNKNLLVSVPGGLIKRIAVSDFSLDWALPATSPHNFPVTALGYASSGSTLASLDERGTLAYWKPAGRALLRTVPGPTDPIIHFEDIWFSATLDRFLGPRGLLWTVPNGAQMPPTSQHVFGGSALSADATLVGGRGESGVEVRRVTDGRVLFQWPEGRGAITFSPDGSLLAMGGAMAIHIARLRDGAIVHRIPQEPWRGPGGIAGQALSFSADGRFLAATTMPRTAVVDVATGEVKRSLAIESSGPFRPALSEGGKTLAIATQTTGLVVSSTETGATLFSDSRSANRERAVLFLDQERMIATADSDGVVRFRCY